MLLKIGPENIQLRVALDGTNRLAGTISKQATVVAKGLPFLGAIVNVFGTVASFTSSLMALRALDLRGDALDKGLDSLGADQSKIWTQMTILNNRIKKQDARLNILEKNLDSLNDDYINLQARYTNLNNIAAQANSNASQAINRLNNINNEPKIRDLNDITA
ncbi:MAG TPA: hypothetical protein DEG17_19780, partial [Cyanobacteria bacterium UBA11149]|nr:hypothetical protein [Cyanobacteria bacterium UBA11367]HBW91040.1 hypothetical protein [Cyanobacteria bacterium UBA11149]HCA95027.1 hypothetical protein [Cyanobacteria bacterium UBA9226]